MCDWNLMRHFLPYLWRNFWAWILNRFHQLSKGHVSIIASRTHLTYQHIHTYLHNHHQHAHIMTLPTQATPQSRREVEERVFRSWGIVGVIVAHFHSLYNQNFIIFAMINTTATSAAFQSINIKINDTLTHQDSHKHVNSSTQ